MDIKDTIMAEKSIIPQKINIFISYTYEGGNLHKQLDNHLAQLKHNNFIDVWYDRDISAGQDWKYEIEIHLNAAQIILLLVSADFLASEYCYSSEMDRALKSVNPNIKLVIFTTIILVNKPFRIVCPLG
jgi:hypothetical protein